MSIKRFFVRLAEKLTGRKCSECRHNRSGRCCHPNGITFMCCWNSITRPGWEYSFGKTYSRLCASLVQLLHLHAKRGLTEDEKMAVRHAHNKLLHTEQKVIYKATYREQDESYSMDLDEKTESGLISED